ncbi:DUF4352 domain-containing protein [Nocardioides sp.]|jgi:hypothetical protein|uniref:DUF4352 domain-containing protein n=1 Tax=Nocardioides sp. TaxID=35761 RepID=UPI002BFA7BD3|nr:DUF4352 domain-containing protein [Nocardioides sp.]HVX54704.1 DUF4352 domain-containing protein [Nocardioides sp.]
MSDPTPGFDPGVNPKAAAKAAKAYAKASRPWYRKKRWWLLAAVVVIVIIVVATNNGGSDGPKKVDTAGSASTSGSKSGSSTGGSDTAGTEKNPIKVGETVELAGTRYTVKKVDTTSQVGGDFGAKADGKFVVVTLTIENMKNETKTFSESAAKLVATDGTQYSTDDDGSIFADNSLILADMQPQLPKTGVLVFDVPPSKLAGAKLKVSDLFGKGDAYVDLGLK